MSINARVGGSFGGTHANREVLILPTGSAAALFVPPESRGLVLFAHGSGSSRFSPRNVGVAGALNRRGIATLLFDLLSPAEEFASSNVFDISLLATRLEAAMDWASAERSTRDHRIGLFGASTGAAAALVVGGRQATRVSAIVSRGGRPDLAGQALDRVRAPTLFIVGGADTGVLQLNEQAFARLRCPKELQVIPGATHLFPEFGAMDAVIGCAADWFERHLAGPSASMKAAAHTGTRHAI